MKLQVTEGTEQGMPDFITKTRARIKKTIDFLVVNRLPITVEIEAERTLYDSMILKADHGDPLSKTGAGRRVLIQWLSPPRGNNLIQSVSPVQVRFSLGKYKLAFTSYYITQSVELPYLGHIITYPEALVLADRRRNDRHEVGSKTAPLFRKSKIGMGQDDLRRKVMISGFLTFLRTELGYW